MLAFTTGHPFTAVVVAVLDAATILVRHRQDLAAWMPAQLPAVPFQRPAGSVVGYVLVTVGARQEGGFLLAVGRFPLQRRLMRPARCDAVAPVVIAVLPLAVTHCGWRNAQLVEFFLAVGRLPFGADETALRIIVKDLTVVAGSDRLPASVVVVLQAVFGQMAVVVRRIRKDGGPTPDRLAVAFKRQHIEKTVCKRCKALWAVVATLAIGIQKTVVPFAQPEVRGAHIDGAIGLTVDAHCSPVGQHDSAGARIPAVVGRIVLEAGDENLILARINRMDRGRACNQPAVGIVFHPLGHGG